MLSNVTPLEEEIQKNVLDELRWEPNVRASDVAVSVRNNVVTLRGVVDSYFKRAEAEDAALRVTGVHAVANDIEVEFPKAGQMSDTAVAELAENAFKWTAHLHIDDRKISVTEGRVTLRGTVDSQRQRERAERVIRRLPGVRDINNHLVVKAPQVVPADLSSRIKSALVRQATVDADQIHVTVSGHEVTLEGTVRSWAERRDAERSAAAAPGVEKVLNSLIISP